VLVKLRPASHCSKSDWRYLTALPTFRNGNPCRPEQRQTASVCDRTPNSSAAWADDRRGSRASVVAIKKPLCLGLSCGQLQSKDTGVWWCVNAIYDKCSRCSRSEIDLAFPLQSANLRQQTLGLLVVTFRFAREFTGNVVVGLPGLLFCVQFANQVADVQVPGQPTRK